MNKKITGIVSYITIIGWIIAFLAGDKDPVSGYAKYVIQLLKLYESLGFTNTSLIIYPEARHELLNELNRDEVMADILNWLESKLK